MDAEEARKVLGLECNEDWHAHLDAFAAARQGIADLVRMAPTETMALRYQEGLMEFDRAMAFFREVDARKRREELLMQYPEIVIPSETGNTVAAETADTAEASVSSPKVQEEIRAETAEASSDSEKSGSRGFLVSLLIVALLAIAGYFGWQEYQNDIKLKQRLQMVAWEAQAAEHLSHRQWDEALSLYALMEKQEPGNPTTRMGRRTVESEMALEQEKYITYWSDAAQVAFETGVWDDVKYAIAMVREKEPNHQGMRDLEAKIALSQSEGERKKWRNAAELAIEEQRWQDALAAIQQVLRVEPQFEQALVWKERAELGVQKMRKNQDKALTLMTKSKAKDQGVYDAEILAWMREARKLDPQNAEILALYERVAAYGRTLRVPGEFKLLQEAVSAAKAQDRIVIAAGRYQASVLVDAPVTIEASGGEVILECEGPKGSILSFGPKSSGSKIHGVSFAHNSLSNENDRFSVILVNGAELEISDCTVRHSAGHGIVAMGGAKLRVVDSRILDNAWDGISAIDAGTQVTIENSQISGNVHHGIDLWKGASGTIQNNRLNENALNGILLDTDQAVIIKNNRFNLNREYGIVVRASGASVITGNQFSQNLLGAVVITQKGKGIDLSNNRFTKNEAAPLLLDKNLPAASYEKNEFDGDLKSTESKAPLTE